VTQHAAKVVGAGWHDTYFRWDLSTPEAVVGRLQELPHTGDVTQPGRSIFMERDRFGKPEHLLGSKHVLVVWTVDTPKHGLIRRLEVQSHLGDDGENDLCPVDEFATRFLRLKKFMGMVGVLPVTEPRLVRCDPAVDVEYENPDDGMRALEALRYARLPRGWYAQYEGPPPHTTVSIKSGTSTVGRAYCRNTKLKNGAPKFGKIRYEREQRFQWQTSLPVEALEHESAAVMFWGAVFGLGRASGRVTRLTREVQTMKLIERVALGEISVTQYEQLSAFLDAERLGLVDRAYSKETARRRRMLAKQLGVSPADAEPLELDESLDDVLAIPRSAWATEAAVA
jgi:hypothetical protein